jgi:outer membrane protein OmpA-like peptidoglycan-associated protein
MTLQSKEDDESDAVDSSSDDNVGNDESNMVLSEKRAKAVYDYLVTRQINLQRLRFKGYGETKPIDSNDTPEGRSRNRRTEFEVW